MGELLPFREPDSGAAGVARVLPDGSIRFRGRVYRNILETPPVWQTLRASTASYAQWRRLYRAIDPKSRS